MPGRKKPAEITIAEDKPCGATFYKCALQVNPFSYGKFRGRSFTNEKEYNEQILEECLNNNIKIVGLADHGNIGNSESLRKLLQDNGIIVFPGFEICSAEKIHMVCLFSPAISTKKLNQILGALQDGSIGDCKETYPSRKTLLEISERVFKENGIWYAAHMEDDNGLLKANDGSGGFWNIWKEEKFVLAGQIKGEVDDLDTKCKQIIKNQTPEYKRLNKVSIINAKDVDKPETLSDLRASCLIKMSELTIEALHQAFLDGDSRIRLNSQIPKTHHSRIETLSIVGGGFFTDGLHMHFNSNLNTIIGGRGTGKSTLLECIRYGIDAIYHSTEAKERAKQILENNLFGGKITMQIFSNRFEKKFIIERHYNQPITIRNEDGTTSSQIIEDILPEIEIFGQNEIFEISEDKSYHLKLVERFLPETSNQHLQVLKQLKQNRQKLVQAYDKKDELESENKQFNRLSEQQKSLQELGLDKKFRESDVYNIEQKRLLLRSNQDASSLNSAIDQLGESTKDIDLHYLDDESIKDVLNKDIFGELKKKWVSFLKILNQKSEELYSTIDDFKVDLETISGNWNNRYRNFSSEFEKLINKLPESGGKKGSQIAKEYSLISQKIASIQGISKDLSNQQRVVTALEKERKDLLTELDNLLFNRFNDLNKTIRRLNKNKLAGKLRIVIQKNGNKQNLEEFLKGLQGIGSKKISWIYDREDLTIRQLVDDIKKGNEELEEKYNLTSTVANALINMSISKLMELEEIILDEQIDIELNVGNDEVPRFIDIGKLSSGQRCTAILHLLMLENNDPLIVDQPEDNLDNAFIANNIVAELRQQKENRQFIFSTHNANIPVFGDAEWIGAMEVINAIAQMPEDNVGSIDKETLKPKVEEILEGGKKAFEFRRLKYGF